ncbi:MAG TPA: prephenate dehydrogenase [Clostridiales bacterium]|nr:prephenate dehydrogenase [Clostridiales bacterium]
MTIGIVGLGLIGGSLAKALKAYTDTVVWGGDISQNVISAALDLGVIDGRLSQNCLSKCDMVVVTLYPAETVEYVKKHARLFKKGAIVMDCCGVKSFVCSALKSVAENAQFIFIGAHPMAGAARGGFENSFPELFLNASLILTPYENTPRKAVKTVWKLALKLGFGRLQIVTPERHDEIVSYTSHLCHLLSCAYISSPLAPEYEGFTAGSFRDMTRIARINETMWSELLIENREHLCREADEFILRLRELMELVRSQDRRGLCRLLRKCREIKENLDAKQEKSG